MQIVPDIVRLVVTIRSVLGARTSGTVVVYYLYICYEIDQWLHSLPWDLALGPEAQSSDGTVSHS